MIRTQIQLPEAEYRELQEIAASERRSIADCIREGIRWFLSRSRAQRDDLEEIAGKFRPLPVEDLKPHDRWIAEAVLESRSRKGSHPEKRGSEASR